MAETAPRTSPRPESREQAAEQKRRDREMQEAFGDMEFRQDLETKGFSDPLVRLGYGAMEGEGEGARILPTPLNAAGVFAIEDNPRLNQWREERGLERGKPGDVYTTGEFQGSNTVWAHELRHRGLMRLRDAVGQDIDGFVETYMPDAPQRSKNIAGYLLSGGPAEEKLMDFMDRDSPVELNLPLEELSDDSENFDELDTQSYNDIKDTILRAAADMNRAAGSPERTVRHEDRVEPEPEKKGFWSRIFGYAEGGLVGRKTRAQMEEENRAAAEQMLPLPHDLPAPSVPLMEMPVDEFLGYLPEITGGNQEQTDFLMREYSRINSLTGGMDSSPSEGYRAIEGTGGFLEKREGDTGWDAVRGVRINPRAGATGVLQGLEQVATAPGRAAQGTMPEADMTNEAFGLASSVAGLGVARAGRGAGVVDESTMNMFGTRGTSGQGIDPERLRTAVDMKRQGIDDGIIWEDTGLEWNPTLKDWEFEIDSSGLKLTDEFLEEVGKDVNLSSGLRNDQGKMTEAGAFTEFYRAVDDMIAEDPGTRLNPTTIDAGKIGGIFDFDELYSEYPFLKDAKLVMRDGFGASYDGYDNVVEMGVETMRNVNTSTIDPENFKSILVHELQHGIQSVNSMAPGGSNNRWIIENDPEVLAMVDQAHDIARNAANYIESDPARFQVMMRESLETREAAQAFAYNKYRADQGEIQARASQMRREMSEGERRETPPSTTYRMALNEQMEKYRVAPGQNMPTAKNLQYAPRDMTDPGDVYPGGNEEYFRQFQSGAPAFAEGGLVADVSNNAMADYFKAASGMMSEAEFTGKHKISTRDFENRFEEQNNVDISGAESFKEITGISKGDNMRKQMSFFNEGGMATTRRDPVSGNEIPPGSTAENVRDDIPARLSEGEYVVPADVVRFFGVNFFEQLREKAKGGMDEMSTDGRIGGQPAPQQQPRGIDPELAQQITQMAEGGLVDPNNVNMLIDKVVEAAKTNPDIQGIFQKRGIMMAEGGLVTGEQPQGSFNAANWGTVGGSYGATPASSGASGGFEYVPFTNASGYTMMVLFINGSPAQTIPQGYTQGQTYVDPNPVVKEEPAVQNRDMDSDDRPNRGAMPVGDGQELDFSFGDPLADVDFSDGAKVIDWANTRLSENNNFFGDWGDKAAQLLGATMGGPIGATLARAATKGYGEARDVAVINAAAQVAEQRGDTATAEALRKISGNAVENFGLRGMNFLSEETWSGDNIAEDYLERRGELSDTAVSGRSSATGALAGQVAGSGGSSSGGSSGSSSGTSSSAPAPVASVSRSNDNGRNDNNTGDYSGQSGSVASTPTATTTAQAQIAARNAGVSASTSAGLSGSQMAAGSGVGTGANGEDEYGPMYKGGLVSRRYKKK